MPENRIRACRNNYDTYEFLYEWVFAIELGFRPNTFSTNVATYREFNLGITGSRLICAGKP